MPQRTSSYIFSLLLLVSCLGFGQEKTKRDSLREAFKPTGIRISTDVISIIKTFTTSDFKGWEVNADVDFRNYYLVAEVGHWQRDILLENGHYTNNGNYWRAGVDINLLKKDLVKNMFFFGVRFGHAKYDEQLTYTIATPEFGDVDKSLTNSNFKANWFEFTTGLKVKVLKSFWMGYTARIKLLPSFSDNQQLQTYDIPGYGLTFKKPWWGFNYYIMFRVPLPKKK